MDVTSMLVGALAGIVAGAVVVLLLRRGRLPRASGTAAGIMQALGRAGSVSGQPCVLSTSARGERGIVETVYRMADGETIATAFFEDPAELGPDDPARAFEQGYALLTRITCDEVCDGESVDRARESMRELLPGARLVPVPMDEAFARLDGVFCKLADRSFLALVTLRGPSAPEDNRSVVFTGDAARQLFDHYRALANKHRDRVVEDRKEEEPRKEPEPPPAPAEEAAAPAEEPPAPAALSVEERPPAAEEQPAPAAPPVEGQPPAAEAPPARPLPPPSAPPPAAEAPRPAPPLLPPSAPPPAVSLGDLAEKTQPPAKQPAIRPEPESAAAAAPGPATVPEPSPPPAPVAPPVEPPVEPPAETEPRREAPKPSAPPLPPPSAPSPFQPPQAVAPAPATEPEDKTPVALPKLGDIPPGPEGPAAEVPGPAAPAPPPVVIPEDTGPAEEAPKPPPDEPAHHPAQVRSSTSIWSAPAPGESPAPAPGGPASVDNPLDFLVGTWSVIETREGRAESHAATITEDGGYYIDGRQRYYLANIEYNVTLNEISFVKVRTEGGVYGKEMLAVEAHDVLRGNGQGGIRHTLLYERQA